MTGRRTTTIPAGYFDGLYGKNPDPWGFSTSPYEAGKYRATLATLSRPRYAAALEVGCAIGIFTAQLAPRCDSLLGIDGSEVALEQARRTCAGLDNLRLEQAMVPEGFPAGRFDLIVLSEVLYYLVPGDLAALAARCLASQQRRGEMILCHWLGETDYPLPGHEAADLFVAAAVRHGYRHDLLHQDVYRLDRLVSPAS